MYEQKRQPKSSIFMIQKGTRTKKSEIEGIMHAQRDSTNTLSAR
jgi:hypothetical protein